MDKSNVAALIEALCDGPLDRQAEPSAELQTLRRAAAKALFEASGANLDDATVVDAEQLTAVLAVLLSGSDQDAARRTLAELALRSSAVRLDAASASAFVDTLEQSAQRAPDHLVEQVLAADAAAAIRAHDATPSLWSRMVNRILPPPRWRVAAACVVVLLASGVSWSLYWREPNQVASPAPPAATSASAPAAVTDAPAATQPSLAAAPRLAGAPPCEGPGRVAAAARVAGRAQAGAERVSAKQANADAAALAGCSPVPAQPFAADAAVKDVLKNAEEPGQAAAPAAGAAAESSTAMDARRAKRGPAQRDPSDRMFGATGHPAAILSEPAAPAAPAAPPVGSQLSR